MARDEKGPDRERPEETTPVSSSSRWRGPDDTTRHGRFLPGALFGKRYRIVGLLGRGGMGEVYQADDLELGQAVALKFLPRSLTGDQSALASLRNEVRVARQIAHPNVCRVYDIGEVDGHYFVSMEYVDGEDLASLLRRIGRLPKEKATDIVRQLATGLATAHELGLVHRDLKPANVMIDGRGRVRIMDFGLAGLAEELRGATDRAGTLAYMAPEQLAGRGASIRSDVYALGLVMYELLTGRRAYDGASVDQLRDRQASGPPPSPSSLVSDSDPAVEQVVMSCLEFDPQRRPSSASAVVAALPGGDLLAAALAAGETPSPEMVAAAGGRGALRPSIGIALLAVTVVGFFAIGHLNNKVALFRLGRPEIAPVVLADRARGILSQIGYPDKPVDVAYGIYSNSALLAHIERTDSSVGRWNDLSGRRPTPYRFWYRQSAGQMLPYDRMAGRVGFGDPPMYTEGMLRILLDQCGRLAQFDSRPAWRQAKPETVIPVDWQRLFALAELDPAGFKEAVPILNPAFPTDDRRAWDGFYPGQPSLPVRIEAGALNGKPVYFCLYDTATRDWLLEQQPEQQSQASGVGQVFAALQGNLWIAVFIAVLLVPTLLAWKNTRAGRADPGSAFRVGLLVFVLALLSELLTRSHYSDFGAEFNTLAPALMNALYSGFLLALIYLAAEPYLRRHWPDLLISWTRLVGGRYRDPLVGRDILVSAAGGTLGMVVYRIGELVPTWFGHAIRRPGGIDSDALLGGRLALAVFLDPGFLVFAGQGIVVMLLLLLLLRRRALAIAVAYTVLTIYTTSARMGSLSDPVQIAILFADAVSMLVGFVVGFRFGFLAMVVYIFFYNCLMHFPITLDTSAWYSGTSTLVLVALGGIAVSAWRIATASYSAPRGQT